MKVRYGTYLIMAAAAAALCIIAGCTAGKGAVKASPVLQGTATEEKAAAQPADVRTPSITAVTAIDFQQLTGKERMAVRYSGAPPEVVLSRRGENVLILRMKNAVQGPGIKGRYEAPDLSNLKRVVLGSPHGDDRGGVDMEITLGAMAPYRVYKEDGSIIADFDVTALTDSLKAPPAAAETVKSERAPQSGSVLESYLEREAESLLKEKTTRYQGEKMSISCQDAPIESVFRLISEISGFNIVAGAGVNQRVTLNLNKVPWDQVLDTLLEVQALGMKKTDKVITVLPLEKLKEAKEEELKKNVAEGRIRQISIEAKIVEVSTSFSRQLGVKWGYGYLDTWKGRDIGVMIGNSAASSFTDVATLPSGIGISGSNIAVNFPSAAAAAGPALGIIAGSSKYILDAKLEALEINGTGKIISSPKVTTVDNVKATIGQGEEIPYVSRDDDGNPEVEMKDAKLELVVTPKITPEGKISMAILASNKYADWGKTNANNENPPLVASNVESTVIVSDGDTIVIGGIYKSSEIDGESGVPWVSKIPILGWLFKEQSIVKEQRELLIFITPKVIGSMTQG